MKTISDKLLQEKIGWSPDFPKEHKAQKQILECNSDLIVIAAGTRFGKTQVAAYKALKTLLVNDKHIWVVAPTYELTNKVFNWMTKWIATGFPSLISGISKRPFPKIETPWNSWVEGKSAETPTGLLGEELDLVIMDECSRIKKDIWDSYIFQRLASREGKAVLISTPFGKNWFEDKFIQAKKTNSGFNFRSRDNPYFPIASWDLAKKTLPEQVFQQEYRASFLPDAAAVFRGVDGIIKDDCLKDVIKDHRYAMGVDLGKHEDFTVLTVIDKYNNNVVYWDRFKNIEYPFQKKRIKATAQRYNNARVVIDSTGVGEPIWEDLRRDGIFVDDYKFTNKSKKELVEKLSIMIEQRLVFIPVLQILIDEIHSFGYHLTDSGNVTYSAPQGLHDDAVISLALAVWGLRGKPNPTSALKQLLGETHKKRNFQYD